MPRPVPDLVDGVEQVDDVETNGHRLGVVRQQEFALDADIDLGVGRHRADIGVTVAQAAAVDRVGAQLDSAPRWPVVAKCFRCGGNPAAELIDGARRGGNELVVIGIDKVRLKVRKLGQAAEIRKRRRAVEQILVRHRVARSLLGHSDVAIGLEVATVVLGVEFDAFVVAAGIVEGAQHQGLAEKAVVDEISRDLVVGIDAEIEIGTAFPV